MRKGMYGICWRNGMSYNRLHSRNTPNPIEMIGNWEWKPGEGQNTTKRKNHKPNITIDGLTRPVS